MSQLSQTTCWFFTFNNPTHPQDGEVLYHILSQICKSFGFQYERGAEGTPHYQGEIQLLNKTRTPSGLIKDPDGEGVFQSIHWERTKNLGAARKYCGKEEGRIDGPWRFGQNKSKGGYHLALEAKSKDEALEVIKVNHPRDWFNNGQRIRENVDRQFYTAPKAFEARAINTFKNIPPEIINWWNRNKNEKQDRYDLLVVVGPTKLGKTQLMRALGKHLYWKGMVKLDDLAKLTDEQYVVIDDIDWEFIPASIKKTVLLGTGDCIVSDKYVRKLRVMANLPCVYICNPPANGFSLFYDSDAYWRANTVVVHINNKLY